MKSVPLSSSSFLLGVSSSCDFSLILVLLYFILLFSSLLWMFCSRTSRNKKRFIELSVKLQHKLTRTYVCYRKQFWLSLNVNNALTSTCIFKWSLNRESRARKMARESSKTSGTEETPFLLSATHRYCLMAVTNMTLPRNTGPADCRMDKSRCSERTFDLSSCDLCRTIQQVMIKGFQSGFNLSWRFNRIRLQ